MALFKVEICGVNTSKLPLLTEDEKKELFKEIKKGNEVAREKYIRGNLRLVLSILQRFSNSNENVDDLFQIGCIGLIKAVDNFDDTLNVKFSTYAVPMISGELKRYLRDNAAIRVSRSIKDIAYKAIYCKENLCKMLKTNLKFPLIYFSLATSFPFFISLNNSFFSSSVNKGNFDVFTPHISTLKRAIYSPAITNL